jgi:hypothetical protein
MRVVILQSNYIPWKGYFDLINDADVFCFYDEVQYTKNDWRNRNRIYSKNGIQWLTIPIKKDAVKQKISEVMLPSGWQKDHFKTLQISYSRAPYFNQLKEIMDDIFVHSSFDTLSEYNHFVIQKISSYIGISTKFDNSANYNLKGDRLERLISLLVDLKATEYISGPSANDYLSGSGIKLTYKSYGPYKEYPQLIQPFENTVSILDLIANIEQSQIKFHIWEK